MNAFLNPNIAYLLLMTGSILTLLALLTPGTHFLEAGALLLLAVSGYQIFSLGFNWWALVILILALVPFIYSIRQTGRTWALVLSLVALIVGSLYMFPGNGFLPAVNPFLAVVVSALSTAYLWVAANKSMQASRARPLQDLQNLIGQLGQARTEIRTSGTVQVASELWSARSGQPIPVGAAVRVVSREGFTLVVEPADQ